MPPKALLDATNASYWDEFGGCLICPVCKFEYVHLRSVEIDQGASIATVDAHGCRLAARDTAGIAHRGSSIRLRMWCESGHEFAQVFQFHKGMTFVRVDVEVAETDDVDRLTELWRD